MSSGTDKENKNQSEEIERLLSEAKKLQALSTGSTSQKQSELNRTLETLKSIGEDLNFFRRSLINAREGFMGFYEHILRPLGEVIGPPFVLVARIYKKIWYRFAYVTNQNTQERSLSRRRSGIVLTITLFFLLMLTPTGLGNAIRFVTTEPLTDGVLLLTSLQTETFYLNNSEEIDPEANIHSVRGCRSEGLCEEQDAAYFRVRPRLSHDVWKFIKYRNPIYVPDHVVAPIAPGVNKCSVTYYGYRMTSSWIARLLRSLQFYPTMLEASCTYIGSGREQVSAPAAQSPEN